MIKPYIIMCFWIGHSWIGLNHECQAGCIVLVEYLYIHSFSHCVILEKFSFDLVLKQLDNICRFYIA